MIIVKPMTANLTRDTETFGKMDPYCVITVGAEKKTSAVHNSGGKNPCWSDTFTFDKKNDILTVQVWDYDSNSKNDMIGQGVLNIGDLWKKQGKLSEWVTISYNGKTSGKIMLDIESTVQNKNVPPGFPPQQYPPQQYPPQQYPPQQYPPQQYPPQQYPPQQYPPQPNQQFPPQPNQQFPPQQYPPQIPQQHMNHPPGQFPPNQYPQQQYNPMKIQFRMNCDKCHGTGTVHKGHKTKPCKRCYQSMGYCKKCLGTKINQKSGKPCKKC